MSAVKIVATGLNSRRPKRYPRPRQAMPVLIGQAANTGVQALAVCLRGMTLGDLRSGRHRTLLIKEMLLGTFNGALTGVTGGIAMFIFATMVKSSLPLMLGLVVFLAITISCCFSGIAGAMVPLGSRNLALIRQRRPASL